MQSSSPSEKKANVKSYRDLIVWRKGIELAKQIYEITVHFPSQETYGLTNQLRRAAVSVPSNIAEGQSRRSSKDFARFLHISLGSLSELDTQLVIAQELGYLSTNQAEPVFAEVVEIRKMLYGLINQLPDIK